MEQENFRTKFLQAKNIFISRKNLDFRRIELGINYYSRYKYLGLLNESHPRDFLSSYYASD